MKKILGFSKRGFRTLLPLVVGYLLLQLALDAFNKISLSIYPASGLLNTLINVVIWFFFTVAIGALIWIPSFRRAALNWTSASPRLYMVIRFFLGSDEEQDIKYQEVLFEFLPRRWKLGIVMKTFTVHMGGLATEMCKVFEPSVPVPFTGTLHTIPKDDLIFTGRTVDKTALTALSLGTKFDINSDLKLQ